MQNPSSPTYGNSRSAHHRTVKWANTQMKDNQGEINKGCSLRDELTGMNPELSSCCAPPVTVVVIVVMIGVMELCVSV